jgi:hypothetical protein
MLSSLIYTTLPVLSFNYYHHFKSSKELKESKSREENALRELRKLAIDRDGWADFYEETLWRFEKVVLTGNNIFMQLIDSLRALLNSSCSLCNLYRIDSNY